jgi:hypothetical protein
MSECNTQPTPTAAPSRNARHSSTRDEAAGLHSACPVCGAMTELRRVGGQTGWVCLVSGYAHYYQARYAHLESWFTSGRGNLREPLIRAMGRAL